MKSLSQRQQLILDYILFEFQEKGYPPSIREIGKAVGLSSSSTVHAHLSKLEQLGLIRRDPTKPRTIEVLVDNSHQKIANQSLWTQMQDISKETSIPFAELLDIAIREFIKKYTDNKKSKFGI
jgi:SOS-response transcriptional repressor LexA